MDQRGDVHNVAKFANEVQKSAELITGVDSRWRTPHEAERWLYLKGYHFQGEFDIAFPDGRRADLRGIVADFADFYNAYMQDRMRKMEQLYREAVDCLPPRTIVIERPTNK